MGPGPVARVTLGAMLRCTPLLFSTVAACAATGTDPIDLTGARWELLESGVDASLRGLSPVDAAVCWASGNGGTVLRTEDGGRNWELRSVPGAEQLDFRDVQAFDADRALVLSAGQPARIYGTQDGGATWTLRYDSPHPDAFFDSFAFFDDRRGIAFSDPVDGRFLVLRTADGGASWREVPEGALPRPIAGEAGFAASGTCVAVRSPDLAWVGTGGAVARVLRSTDGGRRWTAHEVPMLSGQASQGVFSIAFVDARHGVVVGGDYRQSDLARSNAAWSKDGGTRWTPAEVPPGGYRSCVTAVPGRPWTWLAVGLNGTDWSHDGGRTWQALAGDSGQWHAAAFAEDGSGWAVGAHGKVGRLALPAG